MAKTQARAYGAMTGKRYGSFANKTVPVVTQLVIVTVTAGVQDTVTITTGVA